MKNLRFIALFATLFGCQQDRLPCPYSCDDNGSEPDKRVLIIGLDGCRTDAFQLAHTPVMDSLAAAGHVYTGVDRGPHTVSAPGWAALLTGVWSNKHGVTSNSYANADFGAYPDLFTRLKQSFACKRMYYANSHPIVSEGMLRQADHGVVTGNDKEATAEAIEQIRMCRPDVMFVHLNDIDREGHDTDFEPDNGKYIAEIEDCDRQIGQILAAFRATFPDQEHLVFVTTDHGGEGGGHSNRDDDPNVTHVFMIGSTNGTFRWKDTVATQVDLYPSVLQFLDVPVSPDWELDGRSLLEP